MHILQQMQLYLSHWLDRSLAAYKTRHRLVRHMDDLVFTFAFLLLQFGKYTLVHMNNAVGCYVAAKW